MDKQTETPKKSSIATYVVFTAIALIIGWFLVSNPKVKESTIEPISDPRVEVTVDEKSPLEITEASDQTVTYNGEEGKTVLELLKSKEVVETIDSSFGEYVDSINAIAGGTDGKYWSFYVNGEISAIGAADYVTTNADTVEWRFE